MGTHSTNALLRFARRWFDQQTVANVFEPLLADHQREWLDAAPSARLRIAMRTAMTFLIAMVTLAPRALFFTPTPPSMTRRILARLIIFTSVPLGLGSNDTSTSVFSSGAKLTARHSSTRREGGSKLVTRPVSLTLLPAAVSNDSNRRPPSLASRCTTLRFLPMR